MVENARPSEEKYEAEVVLKKLRTSFHASELVVLNARPRELKCDADVVEKKLFCVFQ